MPLFFRTLILIAVALAVVACAGLGANAPGKTHPEFARLCFNGEAQGEGAYFPRTLRDWYWTRDTYASFGSSAPILVYGGGDTLSHSVPGSYYVRLVRSAP